MGSDQIELLALCRVPGVKWNFVAREAQRPGGLDRLRRRRSQEKSGSEGADSLRALEEAKGKLADLRGEAQVILDAAVKDGIRLTTVLDDDYPINLRTIYNLPPFLFYRGELRVDDAKSVAVVGTRNPTEEGERRARRMAAALVEAGVTVLSGLARGIDTAAHEECVKRGGRTIAVLGSGLRKVYPAENVGLARHIADHGAVVSQFWPDAPPTSYNFPRRNVVTSGLGQGTIVVEASATSGAKMQARLALEHGKRVFLLRSLVETMPWARKYLDRGAILVESVDDVLAHLKSTEYLRDATSERRQLVLDGV